jgi:DNA-binding CsgD family transcriptional regulator
MTLSGELCAANGEALCLLDAHTRNGRTTSCTREAIADLLGRVVAMDPFVEAHASFRCPGTPTLHLVAMRIDDEHAGVLLHAESQRGAKAFAQVVDRFGISADEARLALRVRDGLSNAEIAAAFEVSVGAIRTRLSRLCKRLGVRGRAQLALLVENTCRRDNAQTPSPARPEELRLSHPGVARLLEGIGAGLVAVDAEGQWVWANRAARELEAELMAAELDDTIANEWSRVSRDGNAPSRPVAFMGSERIVSLRFSSWSLGDSFLALRIERLSDRPQDHEQYLIERLGLSRQQAQIALMLHQGASPASIAAITGLREASVRVVCSAIHTKLGIHHRTALVILLSRLLPTHMAASALLRRRRPPR